MNEHQTLLHAWQVGRQTYRLLILQVLYEMAVSDSKWKNSLLKQMCQVMTMLLEIGCVSVNSPRNLDPVVSKCQCKDGKRCE